MTLIHPISMSGYRQLLAVACVSFMFSGGAALASPGAHGPNGEHLDAAGPSSISNGPVPSFEARSEAFELMGRLQGGELSILINRFATNEPVLNAQVEVESGALKAPAKFHADMGDYAVDNEPMLKLLATSGEHSIVVTVLAGNDTDLLDGTLKVAGATAQTRDHSHDDGHAHGPSRTVWLITALAILAAVGWFLVRKFKTANTSSKGGAL